ncbi:MAG: FAD:protein FMN transferase, partial [Chloroflexi bacterium]|nr:FAD:protein FMN transferase [Chloroflexota bacterium]
MAELAFRAMGCHVLAAVALHSDRASRALSHVPRWFSAWEQRLSRFRSDSELCQLSARSGQWVKVSPTLFSVLRAALAA